MIFQLYLLVLAALDLVASAAAQEAPCSFFINAAGGLTGPLRQTKTGQNRVGGTFPQSSYYFTNNTLYDSSGKNCLVQPGSSQFQCILAPRAGVTTFSLADDGNLSHDGTESWLACPADGPGYDGSYNVFSDAKSNTTGCEAITLKTGGFNCTALGRPSSSSSASALLQIANATSTSLTPTASPTGASCPTDISSSIYQCPHLIIPTSSQSPNTSFGNSYQAFISPINTTLFNFDIPSTAPYNGTCALLFLFPYSSETDPSAGTYNFSGIEEEEGEHGGIGFAKMAEVANVKTTFDTTGIVAEDYGTTEIIPGNTYTIATFPCQYGQTVTYSASSKGNVELDYFQDSAPKPIGLYIVPCA